MYKLNPFFRIRLGPPVLCDLFLEGKTYELPSVGYLRLFSKLREPMRRDAVESLASEALTIPESDATEAVDDLIALRLLVEESHSYPELPAVKHWADRGWLDALMLHLKTRHLAFADEEVGNPESLKRGVFKEILEREDLPSFWKQYPAARKIELPPPTALPAEKSFEQVLLNRRSNRPFQRRSIPLQTVANMLRYSNLETVRIRQHVEKGVDANPELLFMSGFTALENYVMAFDVEGLEPGIYHYDLERHELGLVRAGLLRQELVKMCIGQAQPYKAGCAFVLSAVWLRYFFRYRHPRAYRTLLVNVAELAQKYLLHASNYDFNMFLTPALNDRFADELFGLDGYSEAPLYVVAVG